MLGECQPEADALGPGGDVAAYDVVGVGDPERRRGAVAGQQSLALGGPACGEAEVAGHRVVRLGAVLEEVAVAEVVVADVARHGELVRAVDGEAAVERCVDAGVLEVGGVSRGAEHVEVEWVAAQDVLLAHPGQLGAVDARLSALHHHDLAAEAVARSWPPRPL